MDGAKGEKSSGIKFQRSIRFGRKNGRGNE